MEFLFKINIQINIEQQMQECKEAYILRSVNT